MDISCPKLICKAQSTRWRMQHLYNVEQNALEKFAVSFVAAKCVVESHVEEVRMATGVMSLGYSHGGESRSRMRAPVGGRWKCCGNPRRAGGASLKRLRGRPLPPPSTLIPGNTAGLGCCCSYRTRFCPSPYPVHSQHFPEVTFAVSRTTSEAHQDIGA